MDVSSTVLAISLGLGAASLYLSIRLFMVISAIRKESRKSYDVSQMVESAWDDFSRRETESRQRLMDRVESFEESTKDRVDKYEKVASGTRERLLKLEQYLKEFFEVELKTVFDSFDKTVSSILEQMKAELLRGLERIEDIQAFVDTKSLAQDRILDGEGSVYRLLADSAPRPDEAPDDSSEAVVRPIRPDDNESSPSRYRIDAEEAD